MFIVVRKIWVILLLIGLLLGVGTFFFKPDPSATSQGQYEIHMVTGEFKTTTEDGQELESYRWDPGTIHVPKGENIKFSILGVNGSEHPFYIEGTDVKGVVQKGKETVVELQFDKKGTYRLICTTHETSADNGPMIAYIIVD